jgi:hypothetical protein
MKQKIKDSNITEIAQVKTHPDLTPFFIMNEGGTCILKSTLNESNLARQLACNYPELYYWPERPENKEIKLSKGGYVRVPHACFTIHPIDENEPAKIVYPDLKRL